MSYQFLFCSRSSTEASYAGIIRRLLASIIDGFLFSTFTTILSIALLHFFTFSGLYIVDEGNEMPNSIIALAVIISFIIYFIFSILMIVKFGGGPGKLLCKIHVKDANTLENVNLIQAIKRTLSYAIFFSIAHILNKIFPELPLGLILCLLVLFFTVRDKRKQTFYDKIANTVVAKINKAEIQQRL